MKGPTAPAPAAPTGLWVVVTCMGRLAFIKQSGPSVLAQPGVRYCLVDYACPDRAGAWLTAHHRERVERGELHVVRVRGERHFHKTRALNLGARAACERGATQLCFADADTLFGVNACAQITALLRPGRFLIAGRNRGRASTRSLTGLLVVDAADFQRAGGYDEAFRDWGAEDLEMRLRLHLRLGLQAHDLPAGLVVPLDHEHQLRTRFLRQPNLRRSWAVNQALLEKRIRAWTGRGREELPASARALLFDHGPGSAPLPARAARAGRPLHVNLISDDNGVGLTQDVRLLRALLEPRGHRVAFVDSRAATARGDLNIFVQKLNPAHLDQAPASIGLFNLEWFQPAWEQHLPRFTQLWAKSLEAHAVFEARGLPSFYTGFASRDLRDPAIAWQHKALHLAGASRQKNTAAVLQAWRDQHERLPPLVVVSRRRLAAGPGVQVLAGRQPQQVIRRLMNECRFHVCPSEQEGWGHVLSEGLSCEALVITTDASPMNEHVRPEFGALVPAVSTLRGLVLSHEVTPAAVARATQELAALDETELEARGRRARAHWEERQRAFTEEAEARLEAIEQQLAGAAEPAAVPPKILILTPVKNARAHLPRYFENLRRLDYPHDRVAISLLESDSDDGTFEQLEASIGSLRGDFARAEIHKLDFNFRPSLPRRAPAIQRERRSILAKSRNHLLVRALRDEAWVLWLDVDVVSYPPDVISRLLATGKDIVVPHCVNPAGRTFDLNTFQLDPSTDRGDEARFVIDGILQPPRGWGRRYLEDLGGQPIVPVDAVGGTMLLVRADLHRAGLLFPPFSYRRYIETEGLAMMARDMGYRCWGLPDLRIVHG
jgi:GT2 family glycosyltransferase